MNGEDSFEARLKRQPPRQIPAEWRREIMAAVRAPEKSRPSLWASLFWPHPKAWAGLAAAWLLVLGLNFGARDSSPPGVSEQAALPPPQLRQVWLQKEQMMAELAGPVEEPPPRLPARNAPPPRSERREEFSNT